MTFKVYVASENFKGDPILAENVVTELMEVNNEVEAIEAAQTFAEEISDHYIYIYFQNSKGQSAFLNPNGYDVEAENWNN